MLLECHNNVCVTIVFVPTICNGETLIVRQRFVDDEVNNKNLFRRSVRYLKQIAKDYNDYDIKSYNIRMEVDYGSSSSSSFTQDS